MVLWIGNGFLASYSGSTSLTGKYPVSDIDIESLSLPQNGMIKMKQSEP